MSNSLSLFSSISGLIAISMFEPMILNLRW